MAVATAVRHALDLENVVLLDDGHAVGLGVAIGDPLELGALLVRRLEDLGLSVELRLAEAVGSGAPAVVAGLVLLLSLSDGRLPGGLLALREADVPALGLLVAGEPVGCVLGLLLAAELGLVCFLGLGATELDIEVVHLTSVGSADLVRLLDVPLAELEEGSAHLVVLGVNAHLDLG